MHTNTYLGQRQIKRPPKGVDALERDTGVEPAYAAWEAAILPMN